MLCMFNTANHQIELGTYNRRTSDETRESNGRWLQRQDNSDETLKIEDLEVSYKTQVMANKANDMPLVLEDLESGSWDFEEESVKLKKLQLHTKK